MYKRILTTIVFVLVLASVVSADTHYVRPSVAGGSDDSAGTSWATAWATISKVNTSTGSGDTVFFGTGIWRGTTLLPVGGTADNPTVYACSSFAFTNGSGQYHFAKIWGSEQVTGWTQIGASNIYHANFTTFSTLYDVGAAFYGDSVLWTQLDSASVTQAGQWWAGNGHVIAYLHDLGSGYDPDNYDMELSDRGVVSFTRAAGLQSNIKFGGLEFKNANNRLIGMSDTRADSLSWIHCKMDKVYGWGGINASLYYTGNLGTADVFTYHKIQACSLGSAWAISASYLPDYAHGIAVELYSLKNSVIDSCKIYGVQTVAGIGFKCAYGGNGLKMILLGLILSRMMPETTFNSIIICAT
jgi:hypothetical protein